MTLPVAELDAPDGQGATEDAEAAFSAGYDSAPAKAAPETNPAQTATEQSREGEQPQSGADRATNDASEPQNGQETTQPGQDATPPKLIAGMPAEEFAAAIKEVAAPLIEEVRTQALAEARKNFGQIGDVNRALKDIQTRLAAGPASRKLTADVFKATNEELPGLGEALARDLAEILGSPAVVAEAQHAQAAAEAQGQPFDADAFFQSRIGPALSQIEARANEHAQLLLVRSVHRDFDKVVASEGFLGWLGTLPMERQKYIRESEDGFVAADAVTEYKAAVAKKNQEAARKKNRLENAVAPQGDGRPGSHIATDEEALFAQGYMNQK